MATSQLYLLPCSCGEKVRVRTRHAGETVTCQCGTKLQVPTIRGLRQLESIDDINETTAPPRSLLEGPLFAIGLLALFAGGVMLAVTLLWPPPALQMDVNQVGMTQEDVDRSKIPVDELGVSDLHDEFLFLRDRARTPQTSYALSIFDAAAMSQKSRLIIGGVIAAVGALLLIAGLAAPRLSSGAEPRGK